MTILHYFNISQPIKSRLAHFGDTTEGNESKRKEDTATWWKTFEQLQKLFRDGATAAHKAGELTADRKHVYFRSGMSTNYQFHFIENKLISIICCIISTHDTLVNIHKN